MGCVPQHGQKIEINIYLNVKKPSAIKYKQSTVKESRDVDIFPISNDSLHTAFLLEIQDTNLSRLFGVFL